MRTFHIDYTNAENKLPDGDIVGKYGEHNATILSITPPAEMTESEEIICYRIAFGLTNCRTVTSEQLEKAETVSLPLNAQITRSDTLSVQLVGYDAENNLVMKSETVKKLKFAESVGGTEIPADGSSHNLGAEVAEMKTKLNKFGEDENGNLTYNNNPISGERPTCSFELPYDDGDNFYVTSKGNNLYALSDTSDTFEVGTEIASLEMWVEDYDGSRWVDFRDMAQYDGSPFILNHYKVRSSFELFSGEVIFCLIYCPENTPALLDKLINGNISKLRITMYME